MGDFIDPFYHGIHLVFLLLVDEYLSAADVAAVVVGKWEMTSLTPMVCNSCSFLLCFPTLQFVLQIWEWLRTWLQDIAVRSMERQPLVHHPCQ